MYHGHAENEHSQKDVTDFYAKFLFLFKTASSEESTMAWKEPRQLSVRENCQYSTCIPTESNRRIKHINGRA